MVEGRTKKKHYFIFICSKKETEDQHQIRSHLRFEQRGQKTQRAGLLREAELELVEADQVRRTRPQPQLGPPVVRRHRRNVLGERKLSGNAFFDADDVEKVGDVAHPKFGADESDDPADGVAPIDRFRAFRQLDPELQIVRQIRFDLFRFCGRVVPVPEQRVFAFVDEPASLQVALLAPLLEGDLLQLLPEQLAVHRAVVQAQAPVLEAL